MCTTIVFGEKASADGSFIVARSADSSSLKAQHFVIHPARQGQTGFYSCKAHGGVNDFTYPLPENSLRYTTIPNWKTQLHGACGFNEAGMGLTGTESIFASEAALAVDPYVKETGITEDDIADVLLCRCRTAREGAAELGRIIEAQGCGEGFGVAFVDETEVWYLETGSGHHWLAQRIPADTYFASGNQGRFQTYDPASDDQMASKNLVEFAVEKGLYNPETDGEFNFSKAYTRDDDRDRTYNDPRVWVMQKRLNPSLEQNPDAGRSFPVFLTPERKGTIEDAKALMRDHFAGTEHDPYGHGLRGDEPWRPIWSKGTDQCDTESAYWKFRRLQTLAMTDYPKLAPIVHEAFAAFEAETSAAQQRMEEEYLALKATSEAAARSHLDAFNLKVIAEAEALAEKLLCRLFTIRTADIEALVPAKNRKNKD